MKADGAEVRTEALAKLNLYLHVTGRRDDGYHLLDSLVVFAGIGDTISVSPADTLSLALDGAFADGIPCGPDNLVLKAAAALQLAANVRAGAAITLTKRLPPSSGIGGGSADAAATLKALSQLWQVDLPDPIALDLALSLGADVPVCLTGRAVFMQGIGETLQSAPDLPPIWAVLVNPGVPVSTPAVFKARTGDFSAVATFDKEPPDARALADMLRLRTNDLEVPAMDVAPVIGAVLDAMKDQDGVLLARMSGSGATCFALFDGLHAAGAAAADLSARHDDWWVATAPLIYDTADLNV